jgi:tetratricopeptide (TPR) repeat protein
MRLGIALLWIGGLLSGQAQAGAQQSKPGTPQPAPANSQKPPTEANPFPDDTTKVPVMTNGDTPVNPDIPARAAPPSPSSDVDPVRSPDDARPGASTDAEGFSSSAAGLDNVMPPPDSDIGSARGRKGKGAAPPPEHHETAAEDEKVGAYYLDGKNWKAALSRYESAVVLDPENPEVYWGMGEAQRHLGKLAEAKASYEKLVEYDPDSKHGKEAKKILKSAEMANAPATAAKQP